MLRVLGRASQRFRNAASVLVRLMSWSGSKIMSLLAKSKKMAALKCGQLGRKP
jgi:hypothetical protein